MQSGPGGQQIYQIVYVSSAAEPIDDVAIDELVATSEERNHCRNITGLLLHKNGRFMQFLEGPRDNVIELYDAICRDTRHEGITVLRHRYIPHRQFPNWSMRLADAGEIERRSGAIFGRLFEGTRQDRQKHHYALESWASMNAFHAGDVHG